MGFQFSGVFADIEPYGTYPATPLSDAVREKWPGARVCRIDHPFRGIGIELPNANSYAQQEQALEATGNVEEFLSTLSTEYPDATFVFVEADCFGGICEYVGYVCRAGIIQQRIDTPATHAQPDGLARLVSHLGVTLPSDPYFEPLVRGYFDRAERV